MIHHDDRTERADALRGLATLADAVPELPLPGLIHVIADDLDHIERLALALTSAGWAFEYRAEDGVHDLRIPLGPGLTVRVWLPVPASSADPAEAVTA